MNNDMTRELGQLEGRVAALERGLHDLGSVINTHLPAVSGREARIATLEREMLEIKSIMADFTKEVRKLTDAIASARGSWKTVVMLAGAAGSIGALLSQFGKLFE